MEESQGNGTKSNAEVQAMADQFTKPPIDRREVLQSLHSALENATAALDSLITRIGNEEAGLTDDNVAVSLAATVHTVQSLVGVAAKAIGIEKLVAKHALDMVIEEQMERLMGKQFLDSLPPNLRKQLLDGLGEKMLEKRGLKL